MDPLSDILSLIKPRYYMFRGFDAAGRWSMQFPSIDGIRCYGLLSGACLLLIDGQADPVSLNCGDFILLTRRQSFRLATDLAFMPDDARKMFATTAVGGVTTVNGGGDVTGLGGFFIFDTQHADLLLNLLPPVIHIVEKEEKSSMRGWLQLMIAEIQDAKPGSSLVAQHVSHMMLIYALRKLLAENSHNGVGWFFALSDKHMNAAISAMHSAPAHPWTLHLLAERACMSRSSFALKFKQTMGEAPLEYLTRWRMILAGSKLTNTTETISAIAASVGYQSDSAFSAAFRRFMGCPPREYALSNARGFSSPEHAHTPA